METDRMLEVIEKDICRTPPPGQPLTLIPKLEASMSKDKKASEASQETVDQDARETPVDSEVQKCGFGSIVESKVAHAQTSKTDDLQGRLARKQPDLCYFKPEEDVPAEIVYYEGLLSQGDLVVWIGREKHRKSNVLLQLAISAATGRGFLTFPFKPDHPLKVVYVEYESKTRTLKTRYNGICDSLELDEGEREDLANNLHIVEVRRMQATGRPFPRFPASKDKAEDMAARRFWKDFADIHKADIYIFDPMRCLHASRENDSEIELLLSALRSNFRGATIIITQHMRKLAGVNDRVRLTDDMREWSDGGRGSVAIKAHSDVILCQERESADGIEKVYFGGFMRDGMDVMPLPLMEKESDSFFFQVVPEVPSTYRASYDALLKAGGPFAKKSDAATVLEQASIHRSTAFRHVDQLILRGLIVKTDLGLEMVTTQKPTGPRALQGAEPIPKRGK